MAKSPQLHKYQKHQSVQILRSQITPDPENARFIDPSSRKRLRDGLEDIGLIETLVWNEDTGMLVGGHQRLDLMDDAAKYDPDTHAGDYLLDVSKVSMDLITQRRANIMLNNSSIQGQFDLSLLERQFDNGVNPFGTGMDELEVEMLYGEDKLQALVARYKPDEALSADEAAAVQDATKTDPELQAKEDAKIALIKERKLSWQANARDQNSADHTLILVFADSDSRAAYVESLGFDPEKRFLPADLFLEAQEELVRLHAGADMEDDPE